MEHLAADFQNLIERNLVVEIEQMSLDMTPKKDVLMLCQVVVTHKRFVVPATDKHPDTRPQKYACLLACLDFQIVQKITMVEDIAKSSVMDRKNQTTVANLLLPAQGTVVIHYYVDLVGIEELVVPNVAFR